LIFIKINTEAKKMAYTPNYTTDDLPNVFTDFLGTGVVNAKTYIPLFLLAGVVLFISGSVATLMATWRR
jgi:hypothetical protein